MKSRYAQQIRTCVNDWFKNHKAQFSDLGGDSTHPSSTAPRIYHLRWKQPDTVIYWLDYIISGHFLLVYGDAGDAVYAWSENITWDFLKSTDLDYFKGKCQASEVGRDYRQWDSRKLFNDIGQHLNERQVSPRHKKEILEDCRNSSCADELRMEAQHSSAWGNVFGHDYCEYIEWGWTINVRCIGHWVGIQMATGNTELMLKRYEI